MDSLSFDIPCFQGSILTDNLPDQIFSGLTPVMQGWNCKRVLGSHGRRRLTPVMQGGNYDDTFFPRAVVG